MTPLNGKATLLCGAIIIGAAVSTYAFADEVYNKAGQYQYTAPKWGEIRSIRVTLIGGGGGGSGGSSNNLTRNGYGRLSSGEIPSGGGGGSGAVTICNFYPPSKGNDVLAITINVGAGGKGGAADDFGGSKGEDGGSSSLTTVDTSIAAYTPVYGSQSGLIAAGGSGATATFESKTPDDGAGGAGGVLSVACRKPDAIPESATAGSSGANGAKDAPGAGAAGSSLTACDGAGAGGKGGLNGIPGVPGENGSDGCVILELVKF